MKTGMAWVAMATTFALVAPAQAAVIAQLGGTAGYLALPGEVNSVTVTVDRGDAIFEDHGTGLLVVAPGCVPLAGRRARCPSPRSLHLDLGDGDDTLVARTPFHVTVSAGPGDDSIATGSTSDELHGDGGDDTLDGGGAGDLLDGGAGADTADYSPRTARVVVTLDRLANDGEHAEGDNVVNTERIVGGQAGDVLVGDAGPNALYGGPGNDSLAGLGGSDILFGGPGKDGINADDPVPEPGAVAFADAVECGDDRDRVFGDAQDAIRDDCEAVDRSGTLGYAVIAGAGPDPPQLGHSVVVRPVSGVILIVPPDPGDPLAAQPVPAYPPVPLDDERNIPVGSVVDTRLGTVEMTTAVDNHGATQVGQFHAGPFQVFQEPTVGATADLALRGGKAFAVCETDQRGPGVKVFTSRTKRGGRGKVVRRLWADAHGTFRTGGRFASATVRGTRWLIADRCDGTLVKVARGVVLVHDAVRNRNIVLKAGERYLARPR